MLALTVLAWLGLGVQTASLAAPVDCCAGMMMTMSAHAPVMAHAMTPDGQSHDMTAAHCPCAHSAASVPLLAALNLAAPMPPTRPLSLVTGAAPQPARIPLLRPPLHASYVVKPYA
ncbi:MAG: hypothetical protein ABW154_02205 [Dyella sp.]